jgi:choline dehydrogenase-like flavoprotein
MAPPAHSRHYDRVSALAYALAAAHARPGEPALAAPYNDLTAFILAQQGNLPDYLRLPMRALTAGFDWLGLGRARGLFRHASPEARTRQIAAWRNSGLGFQRDLVRYYESLVLLALYGRVESGAGKWEGWEEWEGHGGAGRAGASETTDSRVVAEPPAELSCEIAVVGSGPGGAITACLLAEAGREVLLIEEGPFYQLDSCAPFSRTEMLQKYRHGGQTVALGRNKISYVEGRCVGGGSEINSGLYHRTPPDILERWRKEFQVADLADKDLEPHFEACERDLSVSLRPGPAPAAALKLHEGALRLGWKSLEVPRWFRDDPAAVGGGTRQSMTQTFIPRFLRAGGRLLPRTRVSGLREDNGKWSLTAMHRDRRPLRITAASAFLCAGAVQTPALLRRSGIRQNVGNALKLHPTVKVVARFDEEVSPPGMGVPSHQVKEFSPRLSFGCSISTPPYLALGLTDHSQDLDAVVASSARAANYYAMITGTGSGTVRNLPGFRDPLVRYQLRPADLRDLADGVRKLAEMLFASGATAVYPAVSGFPALHAAADVARLPEILPQGRGNLMTIHLFSSCPMGEDVSRCAADSFGRVHGFKNLRIADASLLCTAPGVNPQGTIMALARRNALRSLAS